MVVLEAPDVAEVLKAIGAAVATKWTALATMAVVGLESIRSLAVALGAAN